MPGKTKIEWCDYISNPIRAFGSDDRDGWACVRKSEGCAHCWASTFNVRLGTGLEYTAPNIHQVSSYVKQKELDAIRRFKPRGPFKNGRERALVFMVDMSDLFGEWVDERDIKAVFIAMMTRPDVDFVSLTKRPERAAPWLTRFVREYGKPENVIMGASVENHKRAMERQAPLRAISDLGMRTMVSYEPAVGPVDWGWGNWNFLDWLICGGESGSQARPMSPVWARHARDYAYCQGIPFFFKQWGEWAPLSMVKLSGKTTFKHKPVEVDGFIRMVKVGNGQVGHELDGQEWRQVP